MLSLIIGLMLGILVCRGRPFINGLLTSKSLHGAFAGKEARKDLASNIFRLVKEIRRLSRNVRRISDDVAAIKSRFGSSKRRENPAKRRTRKRTSKSVTRTNKPPAIQQTVPVIKSEVKNEEKRNTKSTAAVLTVQILQTKEKIGKTKAKTSETVKNCHNLARKLTEIAEGADFRLPKAGENLSFSVREFQENGDAIPTFHPMKVESVGKKLIHLRHLISGEPRTLPMEIATQGMIILKPDPDHLKLWLLNFWIIPKIKPKIKFKEWVHQYFPDLEGK
jgi:hypothetical protein